MKKSFALLVAVLASTSLACPAKSTLFNGTSGATIYGLYPYCTTQGKKLAKGFQDGYIQQGAKVNYVEGYRMATTDVEVVKKVITGLGDIANGLGYKYLKQQETEYNILYIFKKANTDTRGMIISVEPTDTDIIVMIVNGEMPWLADK